jgi:hypothetical protein
MAAGTPSSVTLSALTTLATIVCVTVLVERRLPIAPSRSYVENVNVCDPASVGIATVQVKVASGEETTQPGELGVRFCGTAGAESIATLIDWVAGEM